LHNFVAAPSYQGVREPDFMEETGQRSTRDRDVTESGFPSEPGVTPGAEIEAIPDGRPCIAAFIGTQI
jgi:hypothetical protein